LKALFTLNPYSRRHYSLTFASFSQIMLLLTDRKMSPRQPEGGFSQGRSDNIPKVDAFMLIEFAQTCDDYISAEIRNIKSDR